MPGTRWKSRSSPMIPALQEPALRASIERYSYIDARGVQIVSWDHGKYVNHCCQCNTMSTAYGFEIAIRDIEVGEQITDEYGMFNLKEPMKLRCSASSCRGEVRAADLDRLYPVWDEQIKAALDAGRARRATPLVAHRSGVGHRGGALRPLGRRISLRSRARRNQRRRSRALWLSPRLRRGQIRMRPSAQFATLNPSGLG